MSEKSEEKPAKKVILKPYLISKKLFKAMNYFAVSKKGIMPRTSVFSRVYNKCINFAKMNKSLFSAWLLGLMNAYKFF